MTFMTQPATPAPVDRPTYQCEDLDSGLYLRPQTTVTTMTTSHRDPTRPPSAPSVVEEAVLVAAEDFMAVQKERDDLRRAVALISAWRVDPRRTTARLDNILAAVGQSREQGKAVLQIVHWAREESRTRDTE